MESYESIIQNSINNTLSSSYSKLTGFKRVNSSAINIEQLNKIQNDTEYFTVFSEKEWKITQLDILPLFYSEFSCVADNFFIGIFNDNTLLDEEIDNAAFNSYIKSGLFSSINERFLLNKNIFSRIFDLKLDNKIFISYVVAEGDYVLSFGSSENVTRTIKIKNISNSKLFICVRNGFFKFKIKNIIMNFDWVSNSNIEIDATETNVCLSSIPFLTNERKSYLLKTTQDSYQWIIGITDNLTQGSTFLSANPLQFFNFGIEDNLKVFLNDNSVIKYIEEIPLYLNENEILFDYFPQYNLFRIGSRNIYKTFLVDNSLISFNCSIYIKMGTIAKFKVLTNEYDWKDTIFNESNENIVQTFSSNVLSGVKVSLSNMKSFTLPSKYIGDISVRNKLQYLIEFDTFGTNVFIGIEDAYKTSFQILQNYIDSNLARVNLSSGEMIVQGESLGFINFYNSVKTLFISITRLSNNSTLFSFGLKSEQFFKNIIIVNMVNPRLYITSQNESLGVFKLNHVNIPSKYQIMPQTIITQSTDISQLPNIYDSESESGSFRLSSNIEDEWAVLAFDLEHDIIAANVTLLGYKVFIGLVNDNSLSNGLSTIPNSIFLSYLNKNGVLLFPDESNIQLIIDNIKLRDIGLSISGDFYCKFTPFIDSICMSIGKNNYSSRNFKLPLGNFKLIFAVSKASISFYKRRVSSIIKSNWDIDTEIEIDGNDYDIQISSPLISGNTSYFLQMISNPSGLFPDLVVIDNSFLNLPLNIGTLSNNWAIINKNMKNCFIKKNSEEINTGVSNSNIIENSLFFNYGHFHESIESPFIFLGSSPRQYVSNYITSNAVLPSEFKFAINVKKSLVKFKVASHDNWNSAIMNSYANLPLSIAKSLPYESFNQKNAFKTFNEFEKTLIIGPFSTETTKVLCFEYEAFNQFSYVGIRPAIDSVELTGSFTNTNIQMNLFSGEVNINSTISNRPVSILHHKTLVIKVYPSVNGVIVSMGTSFLNANQDIEILDTSLQNFSLYFSARNVSVNPFLILKRFTENGISNTSSQPVSILQPSFLPINYDPMQINQVVGDDTLIRVTSDNYNWSVASWNYIINTGGRLYTYENYGEIEVIPFLNREPEWFIGYMYDDFLNSNAINLVDDELFDNILKSGLAFDGIKRRIITNNKIIGDAFKEISNDNHIYSRMMFQFEMIDFSLSISKLRFEILVNIGFNAAKLASSLLFRSITDSGLDEVPEWKSYDKRKVAFTLFPYIGNSRYNASCISGYSREAYIESGISNLHKDHKYSFIIAVKNGSISYRKKPVSLIPNMFNTESTDISIFNPNRPVILRGDIVNKINGFYFKSDSTDIDPDKVYGERSILNMGYATSNFISLLESNHIVDNLPMYKPKLNFEVSDVFLGPPFDEKRENEPVVPWRYEINDVFNRYKNIELNNFIFINFQIQDDYFLRICSFKSLGLRDELNNKFLVQYGKINNFETMVVVDISNTKFKFYFFWGELLNIPRDESELTIPYIWLDESISEKKLTYYNMGSLDNDLFKSKYRYVYDGDLQTTHSSLSEFYLIDKSRYTTNHQLGSYGTETVLFKKSHIGSEVSFISASSKGGCSFNFELYGNQDVFFGIIQDEVSFTSIFEYKDVFISPYSMIAFINLRTGLVSCGDYVYMSNKLVNTIHVNIKKSLGRTALIVENFGFFSDGDKLLEIPVNFTTRDTFRYVITCGNVTDDRIMMLNMCYLNKELRLSGNRYPWRQFY